jgi:hypothetical protein
LSIGSGASVERVMGVGSSTTEEDTMRFLLLLIGDEEAEGALPREELMAIVQAHMALGQRLRERGAFVLGHALAPSSAVKTVRRTRGDLVSDGPFTETKEQAGGFYIVDAADMEEALAYAREVPLSPGLAVEVRPIQTFE